jgi:uncharacterized protein (DUF2249 family)
MVADLVHEERHQSILPELDQLGEGGHVAVADAEHQLGGAVAGRRSGHHR